MPEHCDDFKEVLTVVFDLKFPGYGMSGFGRRNTDGAPTLAQDGGPTFIGQAVEIPHADAERYVLYVNDGRGYRLLDDVILPERPFVRSVDIRDGTIVYLDRVNTWSPSGPCAEQRRAIYLSVETARRR